MRIGILGGAFDPVHEGHLAVAGAAKAALDLDRVLLLPSGTPPYKRVRASRDERMEMVRLACRGREGLEPCDLECRRPGTTYTVDTMKALRQAHSGDTFVYILGADALKNLDQWRGLDEIARMTGFAAVKRPGEAWPEALPGGVSVTFTDIEGPELSSGDVRRRVAEGGSLAGMVPEAVAEYIRDQGLYLCDYNEDEILERLRKTITLHRWHHTLGVADTAQHLAARCGVDPRRARLAGLLHDCAKSLPYGELRRLTEQYVPDTDEAELDAEPVLHAPAGMVLARRDYGVRDAAILQAIRRHTLGGPDMTAMDALIYVSDFIEPGRRPFPGLETARAAAERDIFQAMGVCARLSADYLISRGQSPQPKTLSIIQTQTGGEAE